MMRIQVAGSVGIAIAIIIMWSLQVHAQVAYMRSGYVIHNKADQSVVLNFSSDNRSWRSYTIASDAADWFDCGSCPYILISTRTDTGAKRVSYRLDCFERYTVSYNDSKGCWDIFKANPPD